MQQIQNLNVIVRKTTPKERKSKIINIEINVTKWHLSLKADIHQGAKNTICAVLLTKQKVIINNVPDIVDINILIDLLIDLGVKV